MKLVYSALLLFTLHSSALAAQTQICERPLKVGVSEYWPFIFAKGGAYKGVDITLLNAISVRTGCQFSYHPLPFKRLVRGIQEGSIDLGTAFLENAARKQFAHFSTSYFSGNDYVYFNKHAVSASAVEQASSLNQLLGLRYAKVLGYSYGEVTDKFLAWIPKDKVSTVDDQDAALRMIKTQSADWIILSELEAAKLFREHGEDFYLSVNPHIIANDNQWHVMYSKQSVPPEVVEAFDEVILEVKGELAESVSRL